MIPGAGDAAIAGRYVKKAAQAVLKQGEKQAAEAAAKQLEKKAAKEAEEAAARRLRARAAEKTKVILDVSFDHISRIPVSRAQDTMSFPIAAFKSEEEKLELEYLAGYLKLTV